jgi:hypothetical protein
VNSLEEARQCYYETSGKASDITRQLAFAGIAVIWIFKNGPDDAPTIPNDLILAAAIFVLALALDFMHYVVKALLWGAYHRHKEKSLRKEGIPLDSDFEFPRYINWPTVVLFWTKIVTLLAGQSVLFIYLAHRWNIV